MVNMKEELLAIINEMLTEDGKEPVAFLDGSLNLREDFHFDSFRLAELTVRIEHRFGVDIFEEGIVTTLQDIIDKLNKGVGHERVVLGD